MRKLIIVATTILLVPVLCVFSQSDNQRVISNLELADRDVRDILQIFAQELETTIIADSTVSGRASLFVRNSMEIERAFQVFLDSNNLYAERTEEVIYISRARVSFRDGVLSVDAENFEIPLLFDRISEAIGKTIIYTGIPAVDVTIHANQLPIEQVIEILIAGIDGYVLESNGTYFRVYRNTVAFNSIPAKPIESEETRTIIDFNGSVFRIDIETATLGEALSALFDAADREYSLFASGETIIRNLNLTNLSFESALRFILEQGNADSIRIGDVQVIFPVQERDILKKYKSTVRIALSGIAVQDLPNLLPADLASAGYYKLDRATNSVILRGSMEEIAPLQEFIEFVDRNASERTLQRFDLAYIDVTQLSEVLPARFQRTDFRIIPNTNSFVMALNEEEGESLRSFVEMIDITSPPTPIRLKYMRTEELLEHLPPSVTGDQIIPTSDPSLVFYVGTQNGYKRLQAELELIDKPIPQIRYDLLVIQYQQGENASWSYSFDSSPAGVDSATAFLGTIGQLLNLNFNVLSKFGYLFALKLNADIGDNNAAILADSTLNGLSGQKLKFQNTNTFRYRDLEVDPDTGETKNSGVTREITSGLFVEVEGWVSGDEMITMDISATVSKQGADVSSSSTNPPPTSEKIVETHVRTPSGEPVVISGLIQQDRDLRIKGIPLLMDIPFIGKIFTQQTESVENTELAIYIVPHLLRPEEAEMTLDERYETWFAKFLGNATDMKP